MKQRFWEIDFLRGLAIVMMIVFHLLLDFNYFYNFNFNLDHGFWKFFQITTAFLFVFLVGMSLLISSGGKKVVFLRLLKRALRIFSFALIISVVTKILFPSEFIIFGILHLIAVSIIFAYFFLNFKYLNLFLGVLIILAGNILKNYTFVPQGTFSSFGIHLDFSFLLFLGFVPKNFISLDYYPIFPWFGVVLLGIFVANLLYVANQRKFALPDLSQNKIIRSFCFLGRYSLFIYLVHQITLFSLFYLVKII